MPESPPPLSETTLAWLRQSAAVDGAAYSQVLLHLLERVEALEADATEQSQSRSYCGIDADRNPWGWALRIEQKTVAPWSPGRAGGESER
jgi:hypothetical protein